MDFQEKANKENIDVYGLMEKRFEWKQIFTYILDWRFRKAVNLPNWLKDQVDAEDGLDDIAKILKKDTKEKTAVSVLNWIYNNIRYTPDMVIWKVAEKWQTAIETSNLCTGDCEDMAILFYVLCRKAGIPTNRLRIVCGDVSGGFGHSWAEFLIVPFAYCMDACYYPDLYQLEYRKPYIIGKSNYKKIWFSYGEQRAYGDLL